MLAFNLVLSLVSEPAISGLFATIDLAGMKICRLLYDVLRVIRPDGLRSDGC